MLTSDERRTLRSKQDAATAKARAAQAAADLEIDSLHISHAVRDVMEWIVGRQRKAERKF